MGLFSKKPGGTFFGNLLRGVANKASGGVLGTGANRIELGQTKTNAQLAAEAGSLAYQIPQDQIINQLVPPDNTKKLWWVVGGLGAALLAVIGYTQGVFTQRGYKKRRR